jgi:predicted transposase YdaD
LSSWKVRIDLGELADFAQQEEIMALSESFLVWEQETLLKERKSIALNLLRQSISVETISQATGLTIQQVQELRPKS